MPHCVRYDTELMPTAESSDKRKIDELPDGNTVGVARSRCPKVLFQPSFVGKELAPATVVAQPVATVPIVFATALHLVSRLFYTTKFAKQKTNLVAEEQQTGFCMVDDGPLPS